MGWDRVVVSGLPRSGTSMMMRMLEAGGLPVHTDGARTADPSNPRGYYELEAVKRLPEAPHALAAYPGGAVKVIFALAYHLPSDERCAVLLMRRPLDQVVASQRRMLERSGAQTLPIEPAELDSALEDFCGWAAAQPHLSVLDVRYPDVLRAPLRESQRVARFLGRTLDTRAMAEAVEPALRSS